MKLVITKFKLGEQGDDGETGNTQRDPEDVDERKRLVPQHVSHENNQVILDHGN